MAIWEALVDGDKRRLNDDGTLFLLQVFGVGLPPARRLKTRSPQQHGSTDLGFRYDEREMRLGFFFNALNETSAVAKRDELYAFWRSLSDIPIQLRYTREDNSVRQIDCHVVGVMDMPWNPDVNQNGLQNFVVQVEAANPMWYDPVQESVAFTSADNTDWWLGLGTIDVANVLEHVESPTAGQSVSNAVVVANGQPWSIFLRTTDPGTGATHSAFYIQAPNAGGGLRFLQGIQNWVVRSNYVYGVTASGEHDYFVVSDGSTITVYRDSTNLGNFADNEGLDGANASSMWADYPGGGSAWSEDIPNAAIFNLELTSGKRAALIAAANGAYSVSKTIIYTGSFLTYPVATITGPITDPILTNVFTGEELDFTGVTIAGGDTYTIDCRFGYKTIKNAAGVNKRAELTASSNLETFHLGADPEVNAGANAFTLTGTGTDANTEVTIAYYERFVGA